jgi:hypothetical protein
VTVAHLHQDDFPAVVTVIAGGCSAGSPEHPPVGEGLVIGVNDAAFYTRCDIALSMDRLWAEHRWAASPAGARSPGGLSAMRLAVFLRRSAAKNLPAARGVITRFDCDHNSTEMSVAPGVLNGTNSGLVALNLAYQMRPSRIVMIGFDLKAGPGGQCHWWPPYPWARPGGATSSGKFKAWASQFKPFAAACREAGIQVEQRGPTQIPAFKEWRR